MGLTVTTAARSDLLSTVERIKLELGITVATFDALLLRLLRQAGDTVRTYCNRNFARQVYAELGPAYGGPYHVTREAPLVALGTVSYRGDVLVDVSISDHAEGFLYREAGFEWTAQAYAGLLAGGRGLDFGAPVPLSEEPVVSFAYTAGFLVPADDVLAADTIYAASADNSFNDTAARFPPLLKAGDVIEVSGFEAAANCGRFVVTGTPTTAKIQVSASLVDAAASAAVSILFSNLPGDVERGVIETVKTFYAQRATDSSIIEKQAGAMRLRYSENRGEGNIGIPPSAVGLLRPWVRSIPR